MAGKTVVVQSINSKDGHVCVDIFQTPDGGFGFEEYRRDVEDPRGWFPIGHHAARRYNSPDAALEAARSAVAWLDAQAPGAR